MASYKSGTRDSLFALPTMIRQEIVKVNKDGRGITENVHVSC